ncbi:hypothetical protein BC939DRAFT_434381 [Gamsiella multidivaricata]|uniref:uncharacterized protein n=1 Tax=Gamsiella multidivaricata TaxID=101098 RepID=UPI00221F4E2D|nr:uncharacterized protein BC939DRAFT_434381 [Gamsiella multidivaricata]KAI7832792.1 hypothetical protein BC939DRAFT_434381 [Gamsiella multidivaricata]
MHINAYLHKALDCYPNGEILPSSPFEFTNDVLVLFLRKNHSLESTLTTDKSIENGAMGESKMGISDTAQSQCRGNSLSLMARPMPHLTPVSDSVCRLLSPGPSRHASRRRIKWRVGGTKEGIVHWDQKASRSPGLCTCTSTLSDKNKKVARERALSVGCRERDRESLGGGDKFLAEAGAGLPSRLKLV